jgi:hypothetical protein
VERAKQGVGADLDMAELYLALPVHGNGLQGGNLHPMALPGTSNRLGVQECIQPVKDAVGGPGTDMILPPLALTLYLSARCWHK